MPRNWPTAAAINERIALSALANGKDHGDLSGSGEIFLRLGRKYGINPGVVVAIMQRESQLGMDGSALPLRRNYAGITAKPDRGNCEPFYHKDRYWACCWTARAGIEMVFQVLAEPQYWGKRLKDVVAVYAPAHENDHDEIWAIYKKVGEDLGIKIGPRTRVSSRWWQDRRRFPRP